MPGRRRWSGLSRSSRTAAVRVAGSSAGAISATRPLEHLAGEGRDRRLDRLAHANEPELILVNLGIDPDPAQIGDLEEDRPLETYWPS